MRHYVSLALIVERIRYIKVLLFIDLINLRHYGTYFIKCHTFK